MWTEIEKYLPRFESAVLTARDAEGYPCSFRCRPEQDRQAGILRIDLLEGTNVQPGPANLLCHSHDDKLWDQKIFLLRGRLEETVDGHVFRPERFVPSIGTGGPIGTVRMLLGVRKASSAYLKKRNLERPRIPWAEIAALKEES